MFVWKNLKTEKYLYSGVMGGAEETDDLSIANNYRDEIHAHMSLDPSPATLGYELVPVEIRETGKEVVVQKRIWGYTSYGCGHDIRNLPMTQQSETPERCPGCKEKADKIYNIL